MAPSSFFFQWIALITITAIPMTIASTISAINHPIFIFVLPFKQILDNYRTKRKKFRMEVLGEKRII
jgi:hypothetical protein